MVTALTLPFGHYCLSERSPHFLTLLQLLLIRGAMISLSYIARTSASKLHPDQACIFIFLPLFSRFIPSPPPCTSLPKDAFNQTEEKSIFIFVILRIDRLFGLFSSTRLSNESLSIENYPHHVRSSLRTFYI